MPAIEFMSKLNAKPYYVLEWSKNIWDSL